MQFLPLTQTELESTLLVLNRALEHDQLTEPERTSIRSVLQKVGAGKIIEDVRSLGKSAPFPLNLTEESKGHETPSEVGSK